MKDKEIQDWIDSNMFHADGTPMIDIQTFYEGAKWMRNKFQENLIQKKSEYEFEKHKAGFIIMGDRQLLKEYWSGAIRSINDLIK